LLASTAFALAVLASCHSNRHPFGTFAEIVFRISGGPQHCALLAETEPQHERGLMERKDLGGYDGMIFRFAADSDGSFYMRNTPLPLSIAWFDAGGRFVSQADMAPCEDREGCPLYPAAGPYRYALEVPKGDLATLDIGPRSVLELGDDGC
jgi:uncharacterized membrane protein (UPF0127 family)